MSSQQSVLYYADALHLPSVLWMRRMLEALGDDVAALVTEEDPGPPYSNNYHVVVVRDDLWSWWWRACHRLGLTASIRKTAKAVATLAEVVDSPRVKVVLMHYLTNAVKYDRVWQATATPVFIHCHGYDVTWNLKLHQPPHLAAHPRDYLDRVRALPEHVHFIANSKLTMRRLREVGIPQHRVHLKYLGVPVPATPPVSVSERAEGITILYLGRLIDCKGPDLVIQAFELACQRGLHGRLVIAGDGPMRDDCERARARSPYRDSIELLGAVDSETGASLRESADIFTAHNRLGPVTGQEEAFGVSFIEAMASGLPVVTCKSGALPELIENGVHGLLLEPCDVDGHAAAFLSLAEKCDLRAEMGRRAWERARDKFSIEQETRVLRTLLGLRAAAPS